MLGWFQALMPREERFFDLFARHAAIVLAGAEALQRTAPGRRHGSSNIASRSSSAKPKPTRSPAQVLTAVRRTFITPFDRTDIQDLITSMDDAIDQMNKTAKVITLFEVRSFEPPMQEMGDIIVQSAKLVLEAVPLLQLDRQQRRPPQCADRAQSSARGAGRRGPRPRAQGAVPRHRETDTSTAPATPWASSSAPRSTTIWKRSSTGSRTSRTKSSSIVIDQL